MDYHTFAKRAKPNVCTCCGVSVENLQNDFIYRSFGRITFEHIGGYFVPLCERCSSRINDLGRYITSGYYKNDVRPPYTVHKITNAYLDKCVEEGFFIRMAVSAQAKIMSAMNSFGLKFKTEKPPQNAYIQELKNIVDMENKRNEYIHIEMSQAHKEEFPIPSLNMFGVPDTKTCTVAEISIYPSIPEKNTDCIVQTKFVCE